MLKELIESVMANLKRGIYATEADVSSGIVRPLLNALGWEIFNPAVCREQYPVGGGGGGMSVGRVDFALFHSNGKPVVFVEVKAPRKATSEGEEQLFRYASSQGVPFLVFTDGAEWNFYLTYGLGGYHDRRFYKLALLESREDIVGVFRNYLEMNAVVSGRAQESARSALEKEEGRKRALRAIPDAWAELLEGPNESLRDLLADQVEKKCGIPPMPKDIENFLAGQLRPPQLTPPLPSPGGNETGGRSSRRTGRKLIGYEYRGNEKRFSFANHVLEDILNVFQDESDTFLPRFKSRTDTDKRCLVAPQKEQVHPESPHLHTRQLKNGWWFSPILSTADITHRVEIAYEVAGVQFGVDLKLKFEER